MLNGGWASHALDHARKLSQIFCLSMALLETSKFCTQPLGPSDSRKTLPINISTAA